MDKGKTLPGLVARAASQGRALIRNTQTRLRDYLFLVRFRSLRASMTASAAKHGVLTDQDVFDKVS